MTLKAVLSDIYDAFQYHATDARLILLHAASRYRIALISRLLTDQNIKVFYYAMDTDDQDVRAFLGGFTHDVSELVPTFGMNVNQVPYTRGDDLGPMLEAFVKDLAELGDGPFFILLDEFDRADVGDDLQLFFERLLDYMPEHCRIIMSGRSLPRMPWMALIAQRKAVMLRDAELITNDFYQNQAVENPRVEVSALGPGHVMLDGEVVESWEGHLPRLLFFFALERPFVTRSEICDAFWPELNTDQAVNVFHVTKRRLHKALDKVNVDVLIHENGYYRVNPELSLHYDVVDFVSSLVEGRVVGETDRAGQIAAWQRAIDLHYRPFLQGHTESWIAQRRHQYQAGYMEALSGMAAVRYDEGRPEHALTLLQRAVNEDPSRQDIHRRIMELYADLGRRSESASHYQRIQDILREYDLPMEEATRQLYRELMAG
jgi:DNA-binding SARP family transcriptional activator